MSKLLDPQEFWESIRSEESAAWPVVCVDLNGVLDIPSRWNGKVEKYPVAPGASLFLFRLRLHFNTVVVFTATMPVEFAIEWLEEHDLLKYVHFVTNHKIPAAVYIDDKAVCHYGNFDDTLQRAIRHVPHWQNHKRLERPQEVEQFISIYDKKPQITDGYNVLEFATVQYIRQLEGKLHDLESGV